MQIVCTGASQRRYDLFKNLEKHRVNTGETLESIAMTNSTIRRLLSDESGTVVADRIRAEAGSFGQGFSPAYRSWILVSLDLICRWLLFAPRRLRKVEFREDAVGRR